jgi:mono/diheme cytochrome c family protein
MPAWSVEFGGPLTDQDVHNVVAFIRSWEPTAPVIEPVVVKPSPERGAVLFASTCAICHGNNGMGGKTAPAINDLSRLEKLDSNWYRAVIKNGRPAKGMPTWGTVLAPSQIDDLVALIDSWRQGKTVQASFDINELLSSAIFSLQNNDIGSAKIQVEQAMSVAPPMAAEILSNADAQINANDSEGALKILQLLQDQWPMGDPVKGKEIFSERCAVCHGAEGQGGVGKVLKPNEFIQGQKNSDLIAFILTGRTGTAMAGFKGRLTEDEVADVVTFLRTWQP